MDTRKVIKSQYFAALAMLRQAVEKCPQALWNDQSYSNVFWHVAYHTLFLTHLYLQPTGEDFTPWEKDLNQNASLEHPSGESQVFSKVDVLDYLAFCLKEVEKQVDVLDLEAESGFHWLSFSKLELQFYNIRHIMQHTGELCERLGAHGEIEVSWVARVS